MIPCDNCKTRPGVEFSGNGEAWLCRKCKRLALCTHCGKRVYRLTEVPPHLRAFPEARELLCGKCWRIRHGRDG